MFVNNKGVSLAEILFSIAILGILVVAAANLERSAYLTGKMTARVEDDPARLLLLQNLKNEIHRADHMEVVSPAKLKLTTGQSKVEWNSERDQVQRIAQTKTAWMVRRGVLFRELTPGRTVEIFFPATGLRAYYSIDGGIR